MNSASLFCPKRELAKLLRYDTSQNYYVLKASKHSFSAWKGSIMPNADEYIVESREFRDFIGVPDDLVRDASTVDGHLNNEAAVTTFMTLNEIFEDVVTASGGTCRVETSTGKEEWKRPYDFDLRVEVPIIRYHVSISKAARENLTETAVWLTAMLPVVYAVFGPTATGSAAVVAALRGILKNYTKLRTADGELCVYRGLSAYRRMFPHTGWPSVDQLCTYLKQGCSKKTECVYRQDPREACLVSVSDLETALSVLEKRGAVEKLATGQWKVVF
jgi:hypothetical protein